LQTTEKAGLIRQAFMGEGLQGAIARMPLERNFKLDHVKEVSCMSASKHTFMMRACCCSDISIGSHQQSFTLKGHKHTHVCNLAAGIVTAVKLLFFLSRHSKKFSSALVNEKLAAKHTQ
jgi:hypothetical protein